MSSTTIRVSLETKSALQHLSKAQGKSVQQVTAEAVEVYRRQALLGAANRAYAALGADEGARRSWDEELSEWDAVLNDGLESE